MRLVAIAALLFLLAGCFTVEETGRSQLLLFPDSVMTEMGVAAYQEVTAAHPELRSGADYEMVRRAGERIARASGRDFAWEFKLLDAPDVVNAFCLPGGKIAVYTGILKVTQNEAALAAVLGHEVAHATAHHGNERMSQELVFAAALTGAAVGLDYTKLDDDKKMLALAALGIGAQIGVLLPYSRDHESEADEIGLRFAIRAGYDPEEAPRLWERMAALGDNGPEFLSTHPDPQKRAARLRELIPKLVAEEQQRQGR